MKKESINKILPFMLLTIILILQIFDGITTDILLESVDYDEDYEMNKFTKLFIRYFGQYGLYFKLYIYDFLFISTAFVWLYRYKFFLYPSLIYFIYCGIWTVQNNLSYL